MRPLFFPALKWATPFFFPGIGSGSKTAAQFLIDFLKDESPTVRSNASQALRQINTSEALKALEEYKQKSS